jgi:uncharacterized lipoprotein YddW (UPF0748 family)
LLIGLAALCLKVAVAAALVWLGTAPSAQAQSGTTPEPGSVLRPEGGPQLRPEANAEIRGTWLTTTANTAIASPAQTATTMRRLREIGLNTVYVEVWKNGYTQYPSTVLQRTLGVAQRPSSALQDPGDPAKETPPRDLLQETLIEAHRNGLPYVAWFEYGFMAAHGSTHNHLRRLKPDWLSRDITGNEVAPNGFVWMNPLHPEARRFLLDITLEAIARYDLDGVQFDDRIVWPYVTMGYDAYTRSVYAAEHAGKQPPADPRDPAWVRWRADKLNALAREFVTELRAAKPGLLLSLSPAVYPWSFEHYLLEWPLWAKWPADARWDEFVPQAYRFSYAAFEATWLQQTQALQATGAYRAPELVAGIRLVGDGANSSWPQLHDSIKLVRQQQQGGHVLWFSRGVLDVFAAELTALYAQDGTGPARNPNFATGWRRPAVPLVPAASGAWQLPTGTRLPAGRYRAVAHDGQQWRYAQDLVWNGGSQPLVLTVKNDGDSSTASERIERVELLVDRRQDNRRTWRGEPAGLH